MTQNSLNLQLLMATGRVLCSQCDMLRHSLKSGLDSGLWTLDSTLYMFCVEKFEGIGRYRIYVFPFISTTFVLFLADFSNVLQ